MTKRDKRFTKLLKVPREARIQEVKTILSDFGYELTRVTGSHHIFTKKDYYPFILPVSNNKIKKRYVKALIEKLNSIYNEI